MFDFTFEAGLLRWRGYAFLAGADHGCYEKEIWTRQINLQSATVSLQVVISLCKRKETAALKLKAAVSNRRVKLSAVRRLFSFAVVRQVLFHISIQIKLIHIFSQQHISEGIYYTA